MSEHAASRDRTYDSHSYVYLASSALTLILITLIYAHRTNPIPGIPVHEIVSVIAEYFWVGVGKI